MEEFKPEKLDTDQIGKDLKYFDDQLKEMEDRIRELNDQISNLQRKENKTSEDDHILSDFILEEKGLMNKKNIVIDNMRDYQKNKQGLV